MNDCSETERIIIFSVGSQADLLHGQGKVSRRGKNLYDASSHLMIPTHSHVDR